MLREMSASLGKLAGCAYLSPTQERHIERAAQHINAAVAEWIGAVMDREALRRSEEAEHPCSGCPHCPGRNADHTATMIDIYHHDFGKREFTPMQLQSLMIAVHNLATISKEIVKSAR